MRHANSNTANILEEDSDGASMTQPMTALQAERLRALATRASFRRIYDESLSRFEAAHLIKALRAELGLPNSA